MTLAFGPRLLRRLYIVSLWCLVPWVLMRLLRRGQQDRAYLHRWRERFGQVALAPAEACLWLHAVSVGEVNAAAPLVRALLEQYPKRPLLVTTTTPTGSARARQVFGSTVMHAYLPLDLPGVVDRFLGRIRPQLAVMMETEIWPNLYLACRERGIPLIIANARLSERSMRGYRWGRSLTRAALACADFIAAQSLADADRFRRLGASEAQLRVTGNLKYDLDISPQWPTQARAWREQWGARPVWIAASTHPDEEAIVIDCNRRLRQRFPELLLLWAPRHPERFAAVIERAHEAGFRVRSRKPDGEPDPTSDCFVINTLGELMAYYAAADVAFVGGSLQAIGGHNLLEPASLGVPALVGPHMFNFRDVTDLLVSCGAVEQVADGNSLGLALEELLANPVECRRRGEAGRLRIESERGALARTLDLVRTCLSA